MNQLPKLQDLKDIRGICFDIDDTFSTEGKLMPEPYAQLWRLKAAGFLLIPITGRPAGWCDHIARFWPVDGVVGENGAFVFLMHENKRIRIDCDENRLVNKQKLLELKKAILKQFSEIVFASDQNYREFDLAIDVCEDVDPWPKDKVNRLLEFSRAQGAVAKLSSVHINIWYGNFDKYSGIDKFLKWSHQNNKSVPGQDQLIYIGDSPNDEPLFKKFKYSVGVANIAPYLESLEYKPRWVMNKKSGEGFSELAELLLVQRPKN